jgi:hypothetical protein
MNVIGHEAVGKKRKEVTVGSAQKLRTNEIDGGRFGERAMTVDGAERKEISVGATIVERRQMSRVISAHAGEGAREIPEVRLKPDTTTDVNDRVWLKPDTTSESR